jgi:hypothetical protein
VPRPLFGALRRLRRGLDTSCAEGIKRFVIFRIMWYKFLQKIHINTLFSNGGMNIEFHIGGKRGFFEWLKKNYYLERKGK